MLHRQLDLVQWLALFLLFFGISLVQMENVTSTTPKQDINAILGFASVIGACKFQYRDFKINSIQEDFRYVKWLSRCIFRKDPQR